MNRLRTRTLVLLAAVLGAVGLLIAGGMLLSGDRRRLVGELPLPALVALGGVLAAVVPLFLVIRRRRGAAQDDRAAAAIMTADRAATERERRQHTRFLARLDHELKNPVTAIRATAAAQAAEGADGERAAWQTVDAQATKLSTLIRDLRKLAELDTRPLEREAVEMEQLIAESVAALAQQNPAAGARVAVTVSRVPWPVPVLQLDGDLVSLALDNVLGNAAKYSSSGPIEVRLRELDGWAVIEVVDAGRGIPAEDLPNIFDELARASNARDVPGSGLGLTLVATIMRRHGGDVSLRSAEGSGSSMTLRLPIGG